MLVVAIKGEGGKEESMIKLIIGYMNWLDGPVEIEVTQFTCGYVC